MPLESSPENPQPLRLISNKVKGWIDRLGPVWVEAQLIDRADNPRCPSPMADAESVSEDDRAERTYGEADEVATAEDDPAESDR